MPSISTKKRIFSNHYFYKKKWPNFRYFKKWFHSAQKLKYNKVTSSITVNLLNTHSSDCFVGQIRNWNSRNWYVITDRFRTNLFNCQWSRHQMKTLNLSALHFPLPPSLSVCSRNVDSLVWQFQIYNINKGLLRVSVEWDWKIHQTKTLLINSNVSKLNGRKHLNKN